MELSRIKILVDKYFSGLTSLEEEQELARYFAETEEIPEEYQPVKMMLGAFKSIRNNTPTINIKAPKEVNQRNRLVFSRKWYIGATAAAIATLVCIGVVIHTSSNKIDTTTTEPNYICYVNGVRIKDDKQAYDEANRLLGNISKDMQLAMAEVDRLTHYTIVK